MSSISGWGRYPVIDTELVKARTIEAARSVTAQNDGMVARGNGRAYGDAAVGARSTLALNALDRIRGFDPTSGLVTVEAGVLLDDLIDVFLPQGFFPAVVPGTRYVTVGGAVAADVHGKNHHREGGFGHHVDSLLLATADGALVSTSREQNRDLFAATVGGMGLTGTILEVTMRLRRVETGWIRQRTVVAHDLTAAVSALSSNERATYSVAWIDCAARGAKLGRSLVFLGEHARLDELEDKVPAKRFPRIRRPGVNLPFEFPASPLNRWTVAAFNELYFRSGARRASSSSLVPAGPYFFPLDGVGYWNRIYGRKGFVQHQCVLPIDTAPAALADILDRVAARGDASFLAVLKMLGPGAGLLSFPFPGFTLTLDFPLTGGVLEFLDELDTVVVRAGGRLYLAKDARQSRTTFEAGYPNLKDFRDVRRSVDASARIRSRLSERLGI